eukprot:365270-Chlamydomonas_euryale.AAC.6
MPFGRRDRVRVAGSGPLREGLAGHFTCCAGLHGVLENGDFMSAQCSRLRFKSQFNKAKHRAWFAGSEGTIANPLVGRAAAARASAMHEACVCVHSLPQGNSFACSMGRPCRLTHTLTLLQLFANCMLPSCPPHKLQYPTGFGMAGSDVTEKGSGRLWDAHAAFVHPCGC